MRKRENRIFVESSHWPLKTGNRPGALLICFEQTISESGDFLTHRKTIQPFLGNSGFAVKASGHLTANCRCRIGIVAQIRPGDFRGLFPNVGLGGRINAYGTLDVLVRLGWPMAVTVGITF